MSGLAESPKNRKLRVLKVRDKKKFIRAFNAKIPSKTFMKKCNNIAKMWKS